MKKIIKTIFMIIVISIPQLIHAENPHSDCTDLYQVGRPCFEEIKNSRSGTLSERHRTVMDFVLGQDSFEGAQKLFGKAKMWQSGDAATSEEKICYFAESGKQHMVMMFSSNAEMSMGAVDEIRLLKGNFAFLDKCSKMNLTSKKFQTKSGLYIGMSVRKMKGILGRPLEENKKMIVYSFCDEKKYKPGDPMYSNCLSDGRSIGQRCSGITAGITRGVVTWILIWFGADYLC